MVAAGAKVMGWYYNGRGVKRGCGGGLWRLKEGRVMCARTGGVW